MVWTDFFTNYYFLSFFLAWLTGSILKAIIASIKLKKGFKLGHGFSNGGFPSTHSATVSSITTAVLLTTGLSAVFYVSLAFALIVMNDAFVLRQHVGKQSEAINELLKDKKKKILNVVYGHTFLQVLGGFLWGVIAASVIYLIMF